ncbi:MAG: hypothetical protein DHS20C18_34630 [Saprospiraceae bacterium]|nr:MAG: hypothetical protein DHS20C18_34630 [Saprospiraceae bacterium]
MVDFAKFTHKGNLAITANILSDMQRPTQLHQKVLAWAVHLFTASGLLAGFMAILAINEAHYREAMVWLLVALFIDGIDGTFARWLKVKEVLPKVDGKNIDYVIDFATYAIIPAYMINQIGLVPESMNLAATFLILLVSAIYYGIEGMVSEDYYFVGFPVLWNMVAFVLIFLVDFSPMMNLMAILFFATLHFVPLKFAYPSRSSPYFWPTLLASILFLGALVGILWIFPERNGWLNGMVYLAIAYFGVHSLVVTFGGMKGKK